MNVRDYIWYTDELRIEPKKPISLSKHAAHAMDNERPPVSDEEVAATIALPDRLERSGNRRAAWRRFGGRYVIVRYVETEDEHDVRTVSCTR